MKNSGSLISFFLVSARKMVGQYCVHYTNIVIIIKLQTCSNFSLLCHMFILHNNINVCVCTVYVFSRLSGGGGGGGVEGGIEGAHECLTAQGPRHP